VRLRLARARFDGEGCIALQQLDLKLVDPAQNAEDDMRLLRLYAEGGDERAFSTLVSRHMSWVYSACCRGLKDRHLAEDAAQAVFLILARRAKNISPKVRLSGWLFKTTRFAVADARKRETRHQRRQELAAQRTTEKMIAAENLTAAEAQLWEVVAPNMDDALAYLCEKDRQAVVLHFFEGLSFSEMGPILGLSKEGAKKRVSRAIDKLRGLFARKGATIAASALIALLAAKSVEAAPVGLATATAAAATGQGPASYMGLAIARGILQLMNNTVSLLVKAMLAAEAAAIILIGVVAMHYSSGGSSTVARNTAAPNPANGNTTSVAAETNSKGATLASKTGLAHQRVMLKSPWAPVDERPYAGGEIEAAAAEVVAKATEAVAGSAPGDVSQLIVYTLPAEELPGGAAAGGGAGGPILRYEVATLHESISGGVSSHVLDVRQLPPGLAGWSQDVFTPAFTKRTNIDGKTDPVADILDPHLKTMIDALLKTGDGEVIVLRQSDGRFHFYLPDALTSGELPNINNSFADYSIKEMRNSLGYQDYRKLVHLAEKPNLQLQYNRAVPEPASISLLALGGALLLRRRRHHSNVSK
jgi:RNA polymerase sigma factor (sigma-70 family)